MMMNLHEEVERLARLNETRTQGRPHAPLMTITEPEPLGVETATLLRDLSARLAEVERERDARAAAAYQEAARVMEMRDDSVAPDNTEAYDRGWSRACKTGAAHIRALARPEETDALDRIREQEREQCAKRFDRLHINWAASKGRNPNDYSSVFSLQAAAIREDKT